jgi:drug/metabolite transporter (DMT)-like permease
VTFLVPVFALLYGAIFLSEAVTLWMVGCGAVILCGTLLATGLLRLRWFETARAAPLKDCE